MNEHEHTEAEREACTACNPPTQVLGVNDRDAVITGQVSRNDRDDQAGG